jgi:Tfp pilus assembly protein FimT
MMIQKKKIKAFTLLEIAVCIGIIALIAGLAAVNAGKLFAYHRYQSEVSDIAVLLNNASRMAVAYAREITVTLTVDSSKRVHLLMCCEDPEVPISPWKDKIFSGIQGLAEKTSKLQKKTYTIAPSGEITSGNSSQLLFDKDNIETLKLLEVKGSKAFLKSVQRKDGG